MVYCVAFNCKNGSFKNQPKQQKVAFFYFPEKNPLRQCWINKVRRKNWKPSTSSKLCSKYFEEPLYFNLGGAGMLPQKHLRISKALQRYFLHFEGRVNKKLLRQTTVFSLSQYFTIQFNKQILGFNNYKYSIYCTTKCIQSQYYGIVLNTVN